jgi:N-acyl-D-aspartate/D-glutamate deacylase
VLDLLIRNGDIVDGSGNPRRRADLGVQDGRIVAIGRDLGAATRVVDAKDRVVAPGFVDIHTHFDAQAFWDPTLSPSPLHGVTTVFAGNCGFSIAPLAPEHSDYLMRMLARVEGMPLEALQAGVPWDWRTTGEYLDRLDGSLAVNAGFMVGHSAIRRLAMGESANQREATSGELAAMVEFLRSGLRAGAMGFSSTWSATHNDESGNPVPSRFASAQEMVALARVCSDFEGTSLEFLPECPPSTSLGEGDMELMIGMSRAANRPLNWNVMQVNERNRDMVEERLAFGQRALDEAARIIMLVMPHTTTNLFTFQTGFALDGIAGWNRAMALPHAEKLALLRDPARRQSLAESAAADPKIGRYLGTWATHVISKTSTPETKRYEGRVVGDIAAEEQKSSFDALLDIVVADGLDTTFILEAPEPTTGDWELRAQVCNDPRAAIGGSDAGAHVDRIGTLNYTTRLLADFPRLHKVASLEQTVRLISQVPAQMYGLRNRGMLRVGAAADVVIFDEDTVAPLPLTTRHDLPAGASRLYTEAVGIDRVFVNGEETVEHGEFTPARPGRVLRSKRDTTNPPMRPGVAHPRIG